MLKSYIKLFLESNRSSQFSPKELTADLLNKVSPSTFVDKTNFTPQQVVDDLEGNFGEDYMISFVKTYKDAKGKSKINLEVNPEMNYATPHGIYTYLLTKEVLDELFLNKTIDGQKFAIRRPYFHIIKVTSPGKVYLDPNKGASKYADNNFLNYKRDVITAIKYILRSLPGNPNGSPVDPTINKDNYKDYLDVHYRRTKIVGVRIFKAWDAVVLKGKGNNKVDFEEFCNEVFLFLDKLSESNLNFRFLKSINRKQRGYLFYKLYFIIYCLSYITPNAKRGAGKSNDAVRFAGMLNSIGIDSIIDKGTSSIHPKQPNQAVIMSTGGRGGEMLDLGIEDAAEFSSYEHIGTYRNIFVECSRDELLELYETAEFLH